MNKKEYVINCYQEYKKFMGNVELPDINPIFDMQNDRRKSVLAYVDTDDMGRSIIPVYIKETLFNYNDKFYKSILYHEFTHIFDGCITFDNTEEENIFNMLMGSYSEYHASQIETLSQLNCPSIKDINAITYNLQTNVFIEDEQIDLEGYIATPLVTSTTILSKSPLEYLLFDKLDYYITYDKAEKNMFYFWGKYNICEKYFSSAQNEILFKEFGIFKEDAVKIYGALKKKNYTDLLDNKNNFYNHYLSHFKSLTFSI